MNTKVIIQKGSFLDKLAYIQDKELKKILVMSNNQKYFEKDIFIAKKKRQNISMKSVELALDEEMSAFMHYKDRGDFDYKLCQIKKIYNNDKNPKVTDEITLTGKYVIYIKNAKGISISNKAKDRDIIQDFIKDIDENILKDTKIIIRSSCKKEDINEAIKEVYALEEVYENIKKRADMTSKPQMIYRQYTQEELFLSKINQEIELCITNDDDVAKKIKKSIFAPRQVEIQDINIWDEYSINTKISSLLEEKITLKNGINIYIQTTEAMCIIDVNSAGYLKYKDTDMNAFYINSYVCQEIAAQIALRDISGIILVDFIDTKDSKLTEKLVKIMQEQLNKDDRKATVKSMSKSNLMQIIRKKEGLSLKELLLDSSDVKLYSVDYILEQLDYKLTNNLQNKEEYAQIEVYIPIFQSIEAEKKLQVLEEKYNIKIKPKFMKKDDFQINFV